MSDRRGKAAMYGESGFERREDEAYYTEPAVTLALDVVLKGVVWEPAAGRGDMAKVLRAKGYDVEESDIRDGQDFLLTLPPGGCRTIITNPPFGPRGVLAEQFIRRALDLMEPVQGMVCMLLRNDYDSAAGRHDIFGGHPAYSQKLVLLFRPRWDWWEREKPEAGPRHNYAWYVWNWAHQPSFGPRVRYVKRPK